MMHAMGVSVNVSKNVNVPFFLAFRRAGIKGGGMKSSKKAKKSGKAKVDREQLIAAIRKAVMESGKNTIVFKEFRAASKMTWHDVRRNFHRWNDALLAAGFEHARIHSATNEDLLVDWGQTVRKLGCIPSRAVYSKVGKFNERTLRVRLGGSWTKVIVAFRNFAMKRKEWTDVMAMLPEPGKEGSARSRLKAGKRGTRSERQARKQALREELQISGDPLYCEGMSHAPVNEMGVMVLFGAMAAKLGFMVESVHKEFPDCQAKRRIGPDAWVTLRIEFEYESRNFRDHGHPPGGCDMIVCWVHNWSDCPPGLKVIALSEELARLRRERMMIAF